MKFMHKRSLIVVLMLSVVLSASGVSAGSGKLMMATTTSTDNTGLLDYLIPEFIKETGID